MNWKEKIFSTGFITTFVLFIGGLFVGFSDIQGEVKAGVMIFASAISFILTIRVFLKNAQLDPKAWILNTNTWAYLAQMGVVLFPNLNSEVFTGIQSIVTNAYAGNWQGIVSALFALIPILWNIFKNSQSGTAVAKA